MNERVTVMIHDCNEKTALNMTTPNDSEHGLKRKTDSSTENDFSRFGLVYGKRILDS